MTLGKRLKVRREQLNLTQSQLADKLGITKGAVGNYENGVSSPKEEVLLKIFDVLEVEPNYLFQDSFTKVDFQCTYEEQDYIRKYRSLDDRGKKNVDTLLNNEYEYISSIQKQPQETEHAYIIHEDRLYMTFYDYGTSAGTGNYLDEWDIPKSTISVPDTPEIRKADFVLRVSGNSMEPDYHDGDRVLVKSQDSVNLNDIAIYIINGESYIKQYKGSYLHSINPSYDDIQMDNNQTIKCVGKVLGKV